MAGPAQVTVRAGLRRDSPWLGILLLTSGFQFGRGAPIAGAAFVAALAAVIADDLGWVRVSGAQALARRFSPPVALSITVGAALAVAIGLQPQFGIGTGVLVCLAGAGAVALIWPDARGGVDGEGRLHSAEHEGPIRRAAIAWAAVAVALCIWELLNFFLSLPSDAADWNHPALSDLIRPFITNPILRVVFAAVWLVGGYALVRRRPYDDLPRGIRERRQRADEGGGQDAESGSERR